MRPQPAGLPDASGEVLRRVRERFGQMLAGRMAPLLGPCADALRARVSVFVEDSPALLYSPAQTAGPADTATPATGAGAAALRQTLQLDGVGQCDLRIDLLLEEVEDGAEAPRPPAAERQAQAQRLAKALTSLLVNAAQEARAETEAGLRQAHFLHQYLHGLSALSGNLAGLFLALGVVPGDGPAGPSEQTIVADLLRTIDYLVRAEQNSALNCLANLMPGFLPGVERSVHIVANPMEELRALLPPYAYQARKQGIEIVFDQAGRGEAMPEVRLERHSFRRMLHNLLSNAVKYSYHGILAADRQRERVVKISCRPRHDDQGRFCKIAFQNYGIGIEPDERCHIGEPGYRGRLARREVEIGTGLGVSEAKRIAQAHGGHLRIDSRPTSPGAPYLTTVDVILPVSARPKRRDGR